MSEIETKRFGRIEYNPEDVIRFPAGLIGFASATEYLLFPHPGGGAFQWMQSVQMADLAFLVCDPLLFVADYRVQVNPKDLDLIDLKDTKDGMVLTILTVPAVDPRKMTANLLGPLVLNTAKKLGMQLVLNDKRYATKHPVFQDHEAEQRQAETDETSC